MLGYLLADIICFEKRTVFRERTPGPNDLKIGHQGQVFTLSTFSHQPLHTASDTCLDHFESKNMSICHIVMSYLMTSRKHGIQIS